MLDIDALRETLLSVLLPWGVKRISLFGSVVHGDSTDASDIEVLVALKQRDQRPPLSMFHWIELEAELSRRLKRDVDLVSEDGLSPSIRPFVEKEKVILYEEG